MLSEEINDLLSVLALMIFADKRVLDDEVKAFVRLADKLQVGRDICLLYTSPSPRDRG